MATSRPRAKKEHGWWPYWLPMTSFLLLAEVGEELPEAAEPALLVAKALVPGAFFLYFLRGGRFPELRGWRFSVGTTSLDVLVGLLGAVLWVGPFLLFPTLRPDSGGFDPEQLGAGAVGLTIALRFAGYALVTPFVEELFVRSWLLRFFEVIVRPGAFRGDFRNVPIAHFSRASCLVASVYFIFSHVRFEWGVMAVWTLLTMAWFYHRRHIVPLILVHAVTNGSILLFVWLSEGWVRDLHGQLGDLWFLV